MIIGGLVDGLVDLIGWVFDRFVVVWVEMGEFLYDVVVWVVLNVLIC